MRVSQRWMFVVVGGCAAVLTACGSSGGGPLGGSTGGSTGGASTSATSGGGASHSTSTGGSSGTTGSGTTGGAASGQLCPQLKAAELAGASATPTGSDPASQKAQFDKAIKVYQAIGAGAPPNVQKAAADMVDVLTTLESAYSDPSHPDVSKLASVSSRIGPDSQVISQYVAANCH